MVGRVGLNAPHGWIKDAFNKRTANRPLLRHLFQQIPRPHTAQLRTHQPPHDLALRLSYEARSCLATSLIHHSIFKIHHSAKRPPPWQAIKEWIAGAPLWPCQPARSSPGSCFHHLPPKCGRSVADDEPDLNWFNQERKPVGDDSSQYDQRVRRSLGEGVSPSWQPTEIPLGDGRILVLDDS